MCGNSNLSPAPSSGDAIAVIHLQRPPGPSPTLPEASNWRIRLSNYGTGDDARTEVTFDAKPGWLWRGPLNLRIHEFGTLSDQYAVAATANPMLHQFVLDPQRSAYATAGTKLGLHVGDEGVIGRKMSVEFRGAVVGEGIIGWL